MGRVALGLVVAAVAVGCTSTRMVQRDGCWVRQTEKWPGRVSEELGFCAKPTPEWSNDRMARLVQECMQQADFRWQNRALAAWSRGEQIPPQESDESIAKTCMAEAATATGLEVENHTLKARVAEVANERDRMHTVVDSDRQFLQQNSGKMVDALGEAAKKPAPAAVATATSTGTAKTESEPQAPATTVVGFAAPAPAAPVIVNGAAPAPVSAEKPVTHSCEVRAIAAKKAGQKPPLCTAPPKTTALADPEAALVPKSVTAP
jgi:hypothetical protein